MCPCVCLCPNSWTETQDQLLVYDLHCWCRSLRYDTGGAWTWGVYIFVIFWPNVQLQYHQISPCAIVLATTILGNMILHCIWLSSCAIFLAHLCNLHGGLISITFCLPVYLWQKFRLDTNLYFAKYRIPIFRVNPFPCIGWALAVTVWAHCHCQVSFFLSARGKKKSMMLSLTRAQLMEIQRQIY